MIKITLLEICLHLQHCVICSKFRINAETHSVIIYFVFNYSIYQCSYVLQQYRSPDWNHISAFCYAGQICFIILTLYLTMLSIIYKQKTGKQQTVSVQASLTTITNRINKPTFIFCTTLQSKSVRLVVSIPVNLTLGIVIIVDNI